MTEVTATRARGSYAKSAEQRRLITEAAVEVFAGAGYHSGSFRDIAAAAEVSEAGIRHHFPNKASLLAAALTYQEARDAERVDLDPSKGLVYFAESLAFARLSMITPRRIELYSVLCAESHPPDHPAHDYFLAHFRRVRGGAATAFAVMAEAGQLRTGVEPARAATLFVAVWEGLQLQWLHERSVVDIAEDLQHFVQQLLQRGAAQELDRMVQAAAPIATPGAR